MSKHDLEKQFKTQRLGKGGSTYGKRLDKTEKERGYLGEIRMPNQRDVMTEMSVGEPNSDELFRPAIIPGMHPADINFIRELDKVPEDVLATSLRHAKKRIKEGKSPFWNARQDLERQFINEDAIPHMGKGGKPKALGLAEEAAKLYTQAEKEIAAEKAAEKAAKAAKKGPALPLDLTRAKPKTKQEITDIADRIARQQLGEHVTKPGETINLAGRSKKEAKRIQDTVYNLERTRKIQPSPEVTGNVGDVNVGVSGDQTISDYRLVDVNGIPIGSVQEGGPQYGWGHVEKDDPFFWASNLGGARPLQNKVNALADLFNTDQIMGHHLSMGPTANNFAMHFADANLKAINNSDVSSKSIKAFNKVIREKFPEFPGIENPEESYLAMREDSEMRKFFNDRMKTPKLTEKLGLPNGLDIQWAITEPDLRNMEILMSGHSVGRMKPGAELVEGAEHGTYTHGIPGISLGHAPELAPFEMAYPDADLYLRSVYNPENLTGTIQKVAPHQRVDEQYLDQMNEYYRRLREIRGFAEGGKVGKAAKALEELNKLYKQAEAEKKAEKVVKAPQIITRSGIADVKKEVANRKGAYAGRRVEHAADLVPNLEQQYTQNALIRGFTGDGDNATGMMVMNPRAFENYAEPIPEDYVNPEYINELSNIARDSGFADVPFLELNRDAETGELKFSGHEGRHRTRALSDLGDESTIVRMLPRYNMREHLPRMSQEEYINALIDELGLDPLVRPQPDEEGSRRLMMLPTIFKDGGRASLEDEFIQANAINMADGGDILVKGNPYGKGSGRPVHGKMKGPEWDVVKRAGELGAKQIKKELTQDTPKQTAIDIAGNFIADILGMPADIATSRPTPIKSKATPWGNIDFSKSKVIEPKEETHPVFGSETMKRIMKEQGITSGEERPLTEGLLTLATPAVIGKAPKIAKGVGKAVKAMEDLPAGMSIKPVGGQWHDIAREKIEKKLGEVTSNEDVSNWLQTTGRKYILNRMGTPEDEVRKLLDKDISHIDPKKLSEMGRDMSTHDKEMVRAKRRIAGFPSEGEAESAAGKRWEMMTDEWIEPNPAKLYQDPRFVESSPWVKNVDPETPIYSNDIGMGVVLRDSGMPEIASALERSLKEGTLKPEQLHKVSMEDAVKLAHEYRVKDEAEVAKDLPKVVDYPEAGMAWHEITHEDPEVLRRILKREGETMQNCIGNYCEDVTDKGTRLFSLRDASGKPHVNIELRTPRGKVEQELANDGHDLEMLKRLSNDEILDLYEIDYPKGAAILRAGDDLMAPIVKQIKGKQNEAPIEDYIPYVQDFISKQGPFNEIRDLGNAGLIDLRRVKQHGVFDEDIPAVNKELYRLFPSEKNPYGGSVLSGQHGVRISPDVMMTEALKDMEGDYVSTDAILNYLRAQEPRPVEHGYSKYWNRKEHEDALKHVQQQMEDEGLTDQ